MVNIVVLGQTQKGICFLVIDLVLILTLFYTYAFYFSGKKSITDELRTLEAFAYHIPHAVFSFLFFLFFFFFLPGTCIGIHLSKFGCESLPNKDNFIFRTNQISLIKNERLLTISSGPL